jgi:ADP-ribosylglycohydrolase
MLGAIIGDIAGSPYEFGAAEVPPGDFDLFPSQANWTDDTLLTLAVYDGVTRSDGDPVRAVQTVTDSLRYFGRTFRPPRGGFGGMFVNWLASDHPRPYGSYGNGSAMRVSCVAWLLPTLAEVEQWAEITAGVTHNHPEGIRGAQATAAAIFLARTGTSPDDIRAYLHERFGYDLSRTWEELRCTDTSGVSCAQTVPEAVTAFLAADSFEDSVRRAIRLGGDTDTRGAIAGSIAEALYPIPAECRAAAVSRLPDPLLGLLTRFEAEVVTPGKPRGAAQSPAEPPTEP